MEVVNKFKFQTLSLIQSNNILLKLLSADDPLMISRFGSTEIKAILYPKAPLYIKPFIKNRVFYNMYNLSGFFPSTEKNIGKFSKLMIEDMQLVDLLASWRVEERLLQANLKQAKKIPLRALEPYFLDNPWSQALKDKKVLVVHPFNGSIENQYNERRHLLFKDEKVLPLFKSLQTIKAVQTIAGNTSAFKDWFEALNWMKREIESKDFDIAIIGCGAYGFPLAAHVKRLGKKAIHLGGATQILFGIKGKRWEDNPAFANVINDYFIQPSNEDKPKNANSVEGGCYW